MRARLKPILIGLRSLIVVAAVMAYLGLGYHYGAHALESHDDHGDTACDLCQLASDSPLKNERADQLVFNAVYTQNHIASYFSPPLKLIATGAFDARAPPLLQFS